MGSPYSIRPRDSVRVCRATIFVQMLKGNSSTEGLLIRNAPRSCHHSSGNGGSKARARFEGPRLRDRDLARACAGARLSPAVGAKASSGIVLATHVPDPRRVSK